MKLFIDDIRNAPSEDWVVARTITEAIRAIERFEFDEISFDHDISHQVTVGSLSRPYPCPECFCAVAFFLVRYWEACGGMNDPKITIHTANPAGAKDLEDILGKGSFKVEVKMMGMANRLEAEL